MRALQSVGLVLAAGAAGVLHSAAERPVPPAAPGQARPMRAATYINPVINRNFPDPSLLNDNGVFYAYATNSGPNMLCARSEDLVHWSVFPEAMPILPDWAKPGRTWAPNVCAWTPGRRYVAYFTAWNRATNQQNIGVAVASLPSGPFDPIPNAAPLVEQAEEGGAIDPSCFTEDDGSRYLVWKNDGNSRGLDTWLWTQKLSPDGLSLVGTPTRLIKQDQPWESRVVEAPTLCKHAGKYYLFYSANDYSTCRYAVGYAVASALRGPYVKPARGPWLAGTPDTCGPGGEDIVRAGDGSEWMAYHAWAHGPHTYRSMSIDALTWDAAGPHLRGPSHSPMPAPLAQAFPNTLPARARKPIHAR